MRPFPFVALLYILKFLTWLVGIFVDHLRGTFGETNISRKSLIDGRFLI